MFSKIIKISIMYNGSIVFLSINYKNTYFYVILMNSKYYLLIMVIQGF